MLLPSRMDDEALVRGADVRHALLTLSPGDVHLSRRAVEAAIDQLPLLHQQTSPHEALMMSECEENSVRRPRRAPLGLVGACCAAATIFAAGVAYGRQNVGNELVVPSLSDMSSPAALYLHARMLQSTSNGTTAAAAAATTSATAGSSTSCAAPCILPTVTTLRLLCSPTGGSPPATAPSPPAASPSVAPAEAVAPTPTDEDAELAVMPSPAASPDADADADVAAVGDGGGDAAAAEGDAGGVTTDPSGMGLSFDFSSADMMPLTVLLVLLCGVPAVITVGMTYCFCIKKP